MKAEAKERYDEHARNLVPLKVGDVVIVQNAGGPQPGRWDKTGQVAEVHGNRQYTVVMDGSRKPLHRNRKFLRVIQPLQSVQEAELPQPHRAEHDQSLEPLQPDPAAEPGPVDPQEELPPVVDYDMAGEAELPQEVQPVQLLIQAPEATPRRSTRSRRQPAWIKDYVQ